jgi:hypothetical protein
MDTVVVRNIWSTIDRLPQACKDEGKAAGIDDGQANAVLFLLKKNNMYNPAKKLCIAESFHNGSK